MPPFSAFNDAVRCCCRKRRSCWMSSFSAFNDLGCTTVRSGVVTPFFGRNKPFLNLQVPGIDIAVDWLIQHPTDQYTPKVQETIHSCLRFFFFPIYTYFLRITFVNVPPFRNSYPGSRGTHSSLFATTVRAFVLIARNCISHVQN